ncbi:N-acetyltransferase [Branchiibius sp. NY16-3462-2]|uniref:N-acetyltransferase n=1 Tax=Branchiibius sp. NY16-3462-2 TaxID=1807500 RepID=UPI0025C5F99B|nr:N-acetyltransferase [Branchiibius sp. NY16-3462-2]
MDLLDHPPADGGWTRIDPWSPGLYAVIAMTGHAFVSAPPSWSDDALTALGVDGFGGAHDPRVLAALAGSDGWIDVLDQMLIADPLDEPPTLTQRHDLDDHARVRRARELRSDVRVFGDRQSVLALGRGIAGYLEAAFEVDPALRGQGLGRSLLLEARRLSDEPVVVAVSPGNVASTRAALAAGYRPAGAVQLYRPMVGT